MNDSFKYSEDYFSLVASNYDSLPLEVKEGFQRVLKTLSPKEEKVLKMRYGFGEERNHTLKEVGKFFSITGERVRQIQLKARRKLMHPSRLKALRKLLNTDELQEQLEKDGHLEVVAFVETAKKLEPYLIEHLKGTPGDINKLPWNICEHLIAEFFASWGYSDVRLVGRNPDTAADVIAIGKESPSGVRIRYFIEVKRDKNKVGVEVVDRVYGAILREQENYGWHIGMIVSFFGFKDSDRIERNLLAMKGIELRGKDDIVQWLREYKPSDKGLWLPNPITNLYDI